jgi:hypothetical protein
MRIGRWTLVLLLTLVSLPASAQFMLGGGIEYFSWTEDTQPIKVKERGPLGVFTIGYTQVKPAGWLLAYRGRFYVGEVDYDGALLFAPNVPVSSQTRYIGAANEGQLRYRTQTFDVLAALGIDAWNRSLSANQEEDYRIVYARLGLEHVNAQRGWLFGAGVKYPLWTQEDAHFTNLGFDQNPKLNPGKDLSGFAQLGYRFDPHWAVIGYADGYRFKESNQVFVTAGGVPQGSFVQPATDTYVIGVKAEYTF